MSAFTALELEYLASQRLGRLATVNPDNHPQNSPVTFQYNPVTDSLDIHGRNLPESKKFRNLKTNAHVAFVVDDVLPPWKPRCVEVRGVAEAIEGDEPLIRIHPTQIISFGLEGDAYNPSNRKIERPAP